MDSNQLHALVQRLQSSDVTEFECEGPHVMLRLRFARSTSFADDVAVPGAASAIESQAQELEKAALVKSPDIGHFLLQHPLGEQVCIGEGKRVAQGQILAFLSSGEVLTAVLAPRDGHVLRQVAIEGALVGYGDVLFELV